MDKSTIERKAVNFVKTALLDTGLIQPEIKEGDTGISWDGELLVYSKSPFKKETFRAKIPVQVKGRSVKKYSKSYSVEVADLKNYEKSKNILFFVVEFEGENHKIYYLALQLFDIKRLLNNAGGKKTISLSFDELPEKSSDILSLINGFIEDAEKQQLLIPDVLSVEDLKPSNNVDQLSIKLKVPHIFTDQDVFKSIKEQKPYVYAISNGMQFAVDRMDFGDHIVIGHHKRVDVCVDGKKFFDGYDVINDKDGQHIEIGPYIKMVFTSEKITIDCKAGGSIADRIRILEFMLAILSGSKLSFGNVTISIEMIVQPDEEISRKKEVLRYYYDIQELFVKLGIRKKLDFDSLNELQRHNLFEFCQSELYDKSVHLGETEDGVRFLGFGDINILCFSLMREDGNRVYSFFRKNLLKYAYQYKNEYYKISPYLYLVQNTDENSFQLIDNINYDDLIDSIKDSKISEITEPLHIQLLLKMLLYYDDEKAECILKAARELSEMLYDFNCSEINYINCCQCLKRQGVMSNEHRQKLVQMKEKTFQTSVKLACSILLESKLECQEYFEQLTDEEKGEFKKYPIMNLFAFN